MPQLEQFLLRGVGVLFHQGREQLARVWIPDVMVVLRLIHGRRSMSPIRPVRSSDSGGRRISLRLRSCAACAIPSDGVHGFPRSLADTIEPRAPIDKLGFTAGYPLLEIDENMQERVSMHAGQYTTTPISWALIAPRYPRTSLGALKGLVCRVWRGTRGRCRTLDLGQGSAS